MPKVKGEKKIRAEKINRQRRNRGEEVEAEIDPHDHAIGAGGDRPSYFSTRERYESFKFHLQF